MYIYKIINNINGKIYIGKTINIKKRWYKHIYLSNKGEDNRHLYNAIRKYGIENFSIEIIEECADETGNEREKHWINVLNTTNNDIGYNSTIGGEGGDTWRLNQHKEETIEKIKKKVIGHKVNKEAIKRLSESKMGVPLSDEQKEKISNTLKEGFLSGHIRFNILPHYDRTGERQSESAKEILSKYRKGKTYEDIYDSNTSEELKCKHKEKWTGENNPQYKNIDINDIVTMIINGYSNKEIACYFETTPTTIWFKLKQCGLNASQIRKEKENENNI